MAGSFVAASAVVGGSSTITPSLPTGTTTDDVVFIFTGSRSADRTLATPTDWTLLASDDRTRLFARRRDSAWSMPAIAWSGGTTSQGAAIAWTIRGLKLTGTVASIVVAPALTITPSNPGNQTGPYIPALTLSSGTDLFIQGVHRWESTADTNGLDLSYFSPPSGWSEAFAGKGLDGNSVSLVGFYQQQSGAAASTSAETITSTPAEDPATISRAITFAMETEPTETDPTDPGVGWTHMTQLAQDFALLPGAAPAGGDPGWGTKAYMPNTVVSGDWVRYRGINTTDINSVSNLGVIAFDDQVDDELPYEFEFDLWNGSAWAAAETAFEFTFDTFGGLLRDQFTGTDAATVSGRTPTNGSGTWAEAKLISSSPSPVGASTIQSNRLSISGDQLGVEYDIGVTDFNATFDLVIPADADSAAFRTYTCFRRTDDANWLNINCRMNFGDLRLQRRIAGSTATYATASGLTWTPGQTYAMRIQCVLNSVKIYRDDVLLLDETITTNQEAGATKFALMSATTGGSVVYDNLEVYEEYTLLEPQVLSVDDTAPEFGATVTFGISPSDAATGAEIPASATWGGVAISIVGGATTSAFSIVSPAEAAYLPTGTYDTVDWPKGVDVVITFPPATNPDLTITLYPVPAVAHNESAATRFFSDVPFAGYDDGDPLPPAGMFAGLTQGNSYYLTATVSTVDSVGDDGRVVPLANGTGNLYYYDGAEWTDLGVVMQFTADISSRSVRVGQTITITPAWWGNDGNAVFTKIGTWPTGTTIDADTGVVTVPGPDDLVSYPEVFDTLSIRMTDGALTDDTNTFDVTVANLNATTPAVWVTQTTSIYGANDAWISYLAGLGYSSGSLNDRMYLWLGDEGYEGTLSDRMAAWSRNNLYPHV